MAINKKNLAVLMVFVILVVVLWLISPALKKDSLEIATINGQVFFLEIADRKYQWQRGLSGRQSLADNEAMLFVFDTYRQPIFWMKDMNFAIDILWIKDGQVVDFDKNVYPSPKGTPLNELAIFSPDIEVNMVMEIVAGSIDRLNIQKGNSVYFGSVK